MKKYLIKLEHGGASKGYHSYVAQAAKNPESAVKKTQREIDTFYRHSMHPPVIVGVQSVSDNAEAELKADIEKFRQDVVEAELSLNRAKNTLFELKLQLSALEDFTHDTADDVQGKFSKS